MDLIKAARDLGHMIQDDPLYKKFIETEKQCDSDLELQRLMSEFNLKRIALNNEASKENSSEEKMKKYNEEVRTVYAEIMKNENMARHMDAKMEFDGTIQRILAIITNSSNGEDPDTTDLSACTHDCSTCGGCH